jgi:hypothetical protein
MMLNLSISANREAVLRAATEGSFIPHDTRRDLLSLTRSIYPDHRLDIGLQQTGSFG